MGQLGLAWSSVAARNQAEGCDGGQQMFKCASAELEKLQQISQIEDECILEQRVA